MGARTTNTNKPQNTRSDGHLLEYFRKSFVRGGGGTNASTAQGLTATGGIISDYTSGPAVYRAHVFTSSGTFTVTAPGAFGDTVDAFVVAGGGGGSGGFPGYGPGRGGGAGGAFVVTTYPVSVNTYPISVGAGGAGAKTGPVSVPFATGRGSSGGNSTFTSPSPQVLTATGGGGGGDYDNPSAVAPVSSGGPGGCGGGGGGYPGAPAPHIAGGTATQPSQNPGVSNLTNYGFAGGTGDSTTGGGGGAGGGTGGVGDNYSAPTSTLRSGGPGIPITYAYGPSSPVTYGSGGPTGGPNTGPTVDATYSTGNGGMGWLTNSSPSKGGNGGSGIVVVRYQIASLTAVQKATGGAISYYGGKTIHTFTSSGTFATEPNWTSASVEYVVVAGGASGGAAGASQGGGAGGGGAGGYLTGTTPIGAHPVSTSIQVGAGGASPKTPGNNHGIVGTPSFFGPPLTAPTGGYGAMADGSPKTGGGPGASGGGGGGGGSTGPNANPGPATGAPFPGTIGSSPASGWGHAGGSGVSGGQGYSGGGGGGAGGAGISGTFGTNGKGGNGGLGMQLPATFRNPLSASSPTGGGLGFLGPTTGYTNGDSSGLYWFAGGGGGGINPNGGGTPVTGYGGVGPGATTSPFAGAGNAGKDAPGSNALENSGSGGGGSGGDSAGYSGNGGSGIVIIAYPS